ncbi:MAG: hypothetical protein Q9170_008233 [Blastenia crenularia]
MTAPVTAATRAITFETSVPVQLNASPLAFTKSTVTVIQTSSGGATLPVSLAGSEVIVPMSAAGLDAPFISVTRAPGLSLPTDDPSQVSSRTDSNSQSKSASTVTNISTSRPSSSSSKATQIITSSIGSSNNTTSFPAGSVHNQSNSNSISPGAAAGIAIGCAIAGALIAAAIFALLFRKRRRRAPARSDAIPLNGFTPVDKGISSPGPSSPAIGIVEKNLPQPAEDQALGGELSRLRTSIKNHVQSYYHTDNAVGSVDQAALGVIAAGNMPLIASTLGSLLANPATRLVAIRFCIAWVAISRIDQNCEPSRSFLPPEIADCLVSISGAREDPSTRMAFLSKWRTVTASLLQSKYGGNTFNSYDSRNPNISEALQALDTVLSSFTAEKRDDRARMQNLEEILRRGARFGFFLFSQPSTFELDWNAPANAGRGVLAISPALVQVGDDSGRRLPRPRTLEEQELARGLESYL